MRKTLQNIVMVFILMQCSSCLDDNRGPSFYGQISLIVSDPIKSDAGERRLTEDQVKFLGVIPMSGNKSKKIIILNPTLSRLDNPQVNIDLATKLNMDPGNSQFNQIKTGKLVTEHLKSIMLPPEFAAPRAKDSLLKINLLSVIISRSKFQRVFFYQSSSNDSIFETGKEKFALYQNLDSLKNAVSDSLCKNSRIQVIIVFNPPGLEKIDKVIAPALIKKTAKVLTSASETFPQANTPAGYLCDYSNHSRYHRLNDGKGGFLKGRIAQRNCVTCGAPVPAANTILPGYVCDKPNKYQKIANGKGGFYKGVLIERNCLDCGGDGEKADPTIQKMRKDYLNHLKSDQQPKTE